MFRLASILYAMAGTVLAGSCIIAALTMGYDTLPYIVGAAAIGAIIGLPVAWFVAKAIQNND